MLESRVLPEVGSSSRVSPSGWATQPSGALIESIIEWHRQRDDLLRAEGNLTRQIKAICRRAVGYHTLLPAAERKVKLAAAQALYDALERDEAPFEVSGATLNLVVARKVISDSLHGAGRGKARRAGIEDSLTRLAKQLPVYQSFIEPLSGMGAIGLAQIVGEAGDLSKYANPAKLWKRMGLGVLNGERQRKCVDKEKAEAHGYSPKRRSVMFVIGDSLLRRPGPYKDLYEIRKQVEIAKAATEGLEVVPAAKIPKGKAAQYRSQGHIHNRAKRYIEKRLLRNLWRAWRGQVGDPVLGHKEECATPLK